MYFCLNVLDFFQYEMLLTAAPTRNILSAFSLSRSFSLARSPSLYM